MNSQIQNITKIIKQAGEIFKKGFADKNLIIEDKANSLDIVTQYDKKIEKFIVTELTKLYPEYNYIGEEGSKIEIKDIDNTFIIDPIDGTMNFSQKNDYCCISIAIYQNGKPHSAVIYRPMKDTLFTAEYNKGAYVNEKQVFKNDNKKNICRKGIHVGWELDPEFINYEAEKTIEYSKVHRESCAVLDICSVGTGDITEYIFSNISIWDVAACSIFAGELGVSVNNFNHSKLKFNSIMKLSGYAK